MSYYAPARREGELRVTVAPPKVPWKLLALLAGVAAVLYVVSKK